MRHRFDWLLCGVSLWCVVGCAPATSPPAANDPSASPPPKTPAESDSRPAAEQETASGSPTATDSPLEPLIAQEPPGTTTEPVAAEPPFAIEEGFTLLTLDDFEAYPSNDETWIETDDGFRSTGKPRGYLYSLAGHQNFTWKLEYRFDRPKSLKDDAKFKGNTGFLVYITGEHKLWPLCLEVQGKHVEMGKIKENGGAAPVVAHDDEAARQAARKPPGEWNQLEIVSRNGSLTVKLNDVPVSRSEPNFLSEGKIGIQAEDHPFAIRRMRLRDE